MYRLVFNGLTAFKLIKFIYYDNCFCLDRKKQIAESIILYIKRNGFTDEELLSMDRLPIKKWISDLDFINLVLDNKGCFKKVGDTLNVSGWSVSSRLRRMGKYIYIKDLFPFNPINNLKK